MTSRDNQEFGQLSALSDGQIRKKAFLAGMGLPGLALSATMAGFGVFAREAGLDSWMALSTTAFIFGLPGQVALVSMLAAGAPLLVVFIAVAMANMRMLLMVISASMQLGLTAEKYPLLNRLLYTHLVAVTGWVQLGRIAPFLPTERRLNYFLPCVLAFYICALIGTAAGFFLGKFIAPDYLKILVFITPFYLMLLIINARQKANRLAVIIGGILCPMLYPLFGSWSILIAGVIGGTIAFFLEEVMGAHSKKEEQR
ncbi:MAG: AzlC family ABC transporter permease [Candidatus Puniceispirillaceae bacterium]